MSPAHSAAEALVPEAELIPDWLPPAKISHTRRLTPAAAAAPGACYWPAGETRVRVTRENRVPRGGRRSAFRAAGGAARPRWPGSPRRSRARHAVTLLTGPGKVRHRPVGGPA